MVEQTKFHEKPTKNRQNHLCSDVCSGHDDTARLQEARKQINMNMRRVMSTCSIEVQTCDTFVLQKASCDGICV